METLQTKLPIYLIIITTCILGTYLFMNWTSENGLSSILDLLYNQKSIKTFQEEIQIVVNTTYYFTILMLLAKTVAVVFKGISMITGKEALSSDFSQATKHAISKLFHSFIVFVASFYYLLRNDGDDLHRHYINLLPFWFLSGSVVYLIGSWLSKWAKLKLYLIGATMSIILWILIAGEINQKGFIKAIISK